MVQIIPAILATTEPEYQEKLKEIAESGLFDNGWIQIDLIDNKFAQNKTIGPEIIAKYSTNLKIEAQLMVEYPESWIDELVKIKVERIVFPIEDTEGVQERIDHIKNHGIEVGLSLNPGTDIEKLDPFVSQINLILVMSVNPGFGGQEFLSDSTKKVTTLHTKYPNVTIEVDGGIGEKEARDLVKAGASNLVIGSHLLEGDIDENVEKFWEAIKG